MALGVVPLAAALPPAVPEPAKAQVRALHVGYAGAGQAHTADDTVSHLLRTALPQQPQGATQLAPSRCMSGVQRLQQITWSKQAALGALSGSSRDAIHAGLLYSAVQPCMMMVMMGVWLPARSEAHANWEWGSGSTVPTGSRPVPARHGPAAWHAPQGDLCRGC